MHPLEVRAPLLDHPLVEWISTLPVDLKRRSGEGKYLSKRAMEPLLPHDTLYRPKKGFAVPLAAWLRGPLRTRLRNALASEALQDAGIFDRSRLERLFAEHDKGRREHSTALWSVLMFEAFLKNEPAG